MSKINRRDWIKTSTLASVGVGSLAFTGLGFISSQNTELISSTDSEVRRLLYNENPNGPSTKIGNAINELIGRCNRYSTFHESDHTVLKNLIAQEEGLSAENVLLGHGSFPHQ